MKKEDFKDPARFLWCVYHRQEWLWKRLTLNPWNPCYEAANDPKCPFSPEWTATDCPEYKPSPFKPK